jgi:hypothetical protein
MGMLWFSKWQLRNFKLTIEWRATTKATNSGIFLQFPDPMGNPWVTVDKGYEVQIDDVGQHDDPKEKGKAIYQTGAIHGIQGPTKVASQDPTSTDPWNEFLIEVKGQTSDVWLNKDHVVTSFLGNRGEEGYLGLRNHGTPATFRKFVIEPLPL